MTISFQCKKCRSVHRAKAEHAGKHVRCPKCSGVLTVPHLASNVHPVNRVGVTNSPKSAVSRLSATRGCEKPFQAEPERAGNCAKGPACGKPLMIPTQGTPATESRSAMASLLDELDEERSLPTPAPAKTSRRSCPNCGNALPPEADLCVRCTNIRSKMSAVEASTSGSLAVVLVFIGAIGVGGIAAKLFVFQPDDLCGIPVIGTPLMTKAFVVSILATVVRGVYSQLFGDENG